MLPLPQVINNMLALPLQSLAASSSRFLLQLTGMWVIQEGNVINLTTAHGMERLDVALACNGLRMLMTMAATVTATVILLPLPNWKRITLLLSIVPIALVSNMARIVATGWCYYLFEGETAKQWAHDWAGLLLMMPLALALVGLELGILSWLVPKESEDDKPVIPLLNVTRERFRQRERRKIRILVKSSLPEEMTFSMIISQTPYRVSFAGGGTDLPAYYRREFGAVLSVTIDQHIYVTLHRRFESTIRVSYSRTEVARTIDDVQHELVREAMRMVEIDEPLEITTIGDVPSGTGMGSSSSLTVGLLTALYGYRHRVVSPKLLAEQACRIEIDILGKPIGRQDQYAAAFGGLNYFRFNPDDTVDVEPVPCRAETLAELEQRALLLYTGQTRDANLILEQQSNTTEDRLDVLRAMRDLADEMRHALAGEGDLDRFAGLLHEGWELKRSLGCGISNDQINEWYTVARRAGAIGGKLLGAGGGGFVLLIAPAWRHRAIREALGRPRELPFKISRCGSRNIFIHY